MKGKWFRRAFAALLTAAILLTSVPVMAAEPIEGVLEAGVISDDKDGEIFLEVKAETLKAACGCIPTSIDTGLGEYDFYVLEPPYKISQYTNIYLYTQCAAHGAGKVNITEDMCSSYQTDSLNQKLSITVTYMGLQTTLKVVYQYPLHNYSDMSASDWFYEDAKYVYQHLYMMGMTPTSWGPYDSLSRAQFATILYRIMEEPEFVTSKSFPDIEPGIWYEDPVLWAAEMGIVTGYQNGNFGPADMITRDQMAVMMYRFAKAYDFDTSNKVDISGYVDASHVPSYAEEAMAWAVANRIITGKDNGRRLAPLENTARAECAAIINRFESWTVYYG